MSSYLNSNIHALLFLIFCLLQFLYRTLHLSLTYQPLSLFKWQLYSAQAMRNKWTVNVFGEGFVEEDDDDQDSLKEALLETSPYLLALTILVSILHSVFELLAFKNGRYGCE